MGAGGTRRGSRRRCRAGEPCAKVVADRLDVLPAGPPHGSHQTGTPSSRPALDLRRRSGPPGSGRQHAVVAEHPDDGDAPLPVRRRLRPDLVRPPRRGTRAPLRRPRPPGLLHQPQRSRVDHRHLPGGVGLHCRLRPAMGKSGPGSPALLGLPRRTAGPPPLRRDRRNPERLRGDPLAQAAPQRDPQRPPGGASPGAPDHRPSPPEPASPHPTPSGSLRTVRPELHGASPTEPSSRTRIPAPDSVRFSSDGSP